MVPHFLGGDRFGVCSASPKLLEATCGEREETRWKMMKTVQEGNKEMVDTSDATSIGDCMSRCCCHSCRQGRWMDGWMGGSKIGGCTQTQRT